MIGADTILAGQKPKVSHRYDFVEAIAIRVETVLQLGKRMATDVMCLRWSHPDGTSVVVERLDESAVLTHMDSDEATAEYVIDCLSERDYVTRCLRNRDIIEPLLTGREAGRLRLKRQGV